MKRRLRGERGRWCASPKRAKADDADARRLMGYSCRGCIDRKTERYCEPRRESQIAAGEVSEAIGGMAQQACLRMLGGGGTQSDERPCFCADLLGQLGCVVAGNVSVVTVIRVGISVVAAMLSRPDVEPVLDSSGDVVMVVSMTPQVEARQDDRCRKINNHRQPCARSAASGHALAVLRPMGHQGHLLAAKRHVSDYT